MSNPGGLRGVSKVDLAHEEAFALGEVDVRPFLRQLVRRSDGAEEVIEPRIMQVLVALARADGGIVTREELYDCCWEGRIVGEDALNRAISRVRRLSDGVGRGSFRIETVTKVGYRLVVLGAAVPRKPPEPPPLPPAGHRVSRRGWVAGALSLAGAGISGLFLLDRSRTPGSSEPSPTIKALEDQGTAAFNQATREGRNQAFGLFRRIVALQPDYADGWGMLGLAYASTAPYRSSAEGAALRMRAREAARRAFALDPDNARGQAILGMLAPTLGGWLDRERHVRAALARRPDDAPLLLALAFTMANVGRSRESLSLHERAFRLFPVLMPSHHYGRIMALWGAGRLEETDDAIAEAAAIFPTHFAIWFARFYILMYSGRASEAIALAENRDQRPTGIETAEFDSIVRVARAMLSREAGATDAVVAEQLDHARRGAGFAENAMQFASALGRVDDAFVIADAYYLDRGFTVPEIRFTPEQGAYTPRRDRFTAHLFLPCTAAMRADRRFEKLVGEIGMRRYWRLSGSTPDYLRCG